MKIIDRIKSFFGGPYNGAQEGTWRGPFYGLGEYGNHFLMSPVDDGWQRHLNVNGAQDAVPAVNAAGSAYARAVSTCRVGHYIIQPNGEHKKQNSGAIAELLRNPNDYETFPQYIYNTVAEMMFKGASLSVIIQNERAEPAALHRITYGNWQPYIDPETGAVFYGVSNSGNPLIVSELEYMVPARNAIHYRQYTPRHPLHGESAIKAAAIAIGINVALSQSQVAFFSQMRRASGILSTDQQLTKDQMKQLRAAFDQQSQHMKQGGIPILHSGFKFQQLSITSEDAELIAAQRMSIEDIARAFGVPLPIIGDLSKATLNNAETLINHWLSLGLGSLLENFERTFDKSFRFDALNRIEFDTAPLLRADFTARIDGLTKAIQGGLVTVNEARRREGLAAVEFGDEPMLQAQMVPISYAAQQQAAPAVVPPAQTQPNEPGDDEPEADEPEADEEITRALVHSMLVKRWKQSA